MNSACTVKLSKIIPKNNDKISYLYIKTIFRPEKTNIFLPTGSFSVNNLLNRLTKKKSSASLITH